MSDPLMLIEVIRVVFKSFKAIQNVVQEIKILHRLSRQLMNRTLAFNGRLNTLQQSPKLYLHLTGALKEFELTVKDVYDFLQELKEIKRWRVIFLKGSLVNQYYELQDRLDRCRDDLQFELMLNHTTEKQALEDDLKDILQYFMQDQCGDMKQFQVVHDQGNDVKQVISELVKTLTEDKKVTASRIIDDAKMVLDAKNKHDLKQALKERWDDEVKLLTIEETLVEKRGGAIGSGGFGLIYLGRYSGADVAIKCLRKEKSLISDSKSLLEEVRLQNKCIFKYVAHMYGFCRIQNELFAVMEYAICGSLTSFLHFATGYAGQLSVPGQLSLVIPVDVVVMLLYEIAMGIEFIHSKCIIHRDIKPSNILLDASLTPKLTDFGLSKELQAMGDHSHTGNVGSFSYMAPEVIKESQSKARYTYTSDVYSFGVVMFEMCHRLYGEGDFAFSNVDTDLPSCFPSAVNEIKNCCLDWNPHFRYGRDSDEGASLSSSLDSVLVGFGGSPRGTFSDIKCRESRLSFHRICDAATISATLFCGNEAHEYNKSSTRTSATAPTERFSNSGSSDDAHLDGRQNQRLIMKERTTCSHKRMQNFEAQLENDRMQNKQHTENSYSQSKSSPKKPHVIIESDPKQTCILIHRRSILFAVAAFVAAVIAVVVIAVFLIPSGSDPLSPDGNTTILNSISESKSSAEDVAVPWTAGSPLTSDACFETSYELYNAVRAYNAKDVAGFSKYGTEMDNWCVSKITNFSYLFTDMVDFNEPIGSWNTSLVTDMSWMFYGASSFNQDLSGWSTSSVTNMRHMFHSATKFNQNLYPWDTSSVTDMSYMFNDASKFNQNLSTWDTSMVMDMSHMFSGAFNFNQDLSTWDISEVTTLAAMFAGASKFYQNLSAWDTSSVSDMSYMFWGASNFNQDISTWDTSSVTKMYYMFSGASSFNRNISTWDTSLVTEMSHMFENASSFDQDVSQWDTSSVTGMSYIFQFASSFDQDISKWDISSVTDISHMFHGASSFNHSLSTLDTSSVMKMSRTFEAASSFDQDLSTWDTSSVTDMSYMFYGATLFNHSLSTWDTSSVENMRWMFYGASSFNQNISAWDTSSVTDMSDMFHDASTFNHNLCSWGERLNPSGHNVTHMFSNTNCPSTTDPDTTSKSPFCYVCYYIGP